MNILDAFGPEPWPTLPPPTLPATQSEIAALVAAAEARYAVAN